MSKDSALGFFGHLFSFVGVSVLLAAPFIASNLNVLESAHSVFGFVWGLLGAVLSGILVAFATIGYMLLNIGSIVSMFLLGFMILGLLYFVFATSVVYNFLHMITVFAKNNSPLSSKFLSFLFSMFIVAILSVFAFWISGQSLVKINPSSNTIEDNATLANNTQIPSIPTNTTMPALNISGMIINMT